MSNLLCEILDGNGDMDLLKTDITDLWNRAIDAAAQVAQDLSLGCEEGSCNRVYEEDVAEAIRALKK